MQRRQKEFGPGPRVAIDREAKVRIMHAGRVGRRSGKLTRAWLDVLHAIVWLIHDTRSGQCNPSYEHIAAKAGCSRSTVHQAIIKLEQLGLLSWVHRIRRVRERVRDELLGGWMLVWRVYRTSNAYVIHEPVDKTALLAKSRFFKSTSWDPVRKSDSLGFPPLLPDQQNLAAQSPDRKERFT